MGDTLPDEGKGLDMLPSNGGTTSKQRSKLTGKLTGKLNCLFRTALCAGALSLACAAPAAASPTLSEKTASTEAVPFRPVTPWAEELGARVRLVLAETAHDDRPFLAGVEMEIDPGWHTYWRKPGDSGSAPVFGWSKSDNIDYAHVRWPAPRRFDNPGDVTYGYDTTVIWPVLVMPREAEKPVTLHLDLFYAVCSQICVPHDVTLELTVPAAGKSARKSGEKTGEGFKAASDTEYAQDIRAALARVPLAPKIPGRVSAALKTENGKGTLDVTLKETPDAPPMLAVEGPYYAWFGVPDVTRDAKAIRYAVPVRIDKDKSLDGKTLTLTLARADGRGGYETEFTVPGGEAATKPKPGAEAGQ
ncbi:protein-disulfide reductase DsbD domain-containing protein [Parvibaculum sp.]|uniref:protein-disulfide reductase DsbD domain-containing protein n=1 Tax=Parvibaculum sp. TaxID=2024848 RepID=UPI000C98A146|nr:protein-disulfide reductase DsbD domain-containing protein [Parvibaculum sp.]MAB14473.1 hypothetical protein [Parvibaculum sp.]